MYKLYDMYIRKLLDKSYDEKNIIDTLGELVSESNNFRYLVIYHDELNDMDIIYKRINCVGDYYDYTKQYQKRLLESKKSCLELKRDILNKKGRIK